MAVRLFALFAGLGYTILGIVASIPNFLWEPAMARPEQYGIRLGRGFLYGLLPVNIPHNLLWIVLGVGGIVASASYASARTYARLLFVITLLLALLGFVPLGVDRLWGFLPLDGFNILIHAWTAILAWYFGFVYTFVEWEPVAQ